MKKNKLLRTLIPLTTMGVGLGVALPLASCSCGNEDNGVIHFSNIQQLKDFITSESSKLFVDDADAHKDWSTGYNQTTSSYPVDDPTMLAWFNDRLNEESIALIVMAQFVSLDFTNPVTFQYKERIASFVATTISGVAYVVNSTKSTNVFYLDVTKNDIVTNKSGSLLRVGTHNNLRDMFFDGSMGNSGGIYLEFWPNVKFPTGDPTT